MNLKIKQKASFIGGMAAMMAALSLAPDARANVYATDIKLNGGFSSITNSVGGSITISYILNEAATRGTTIKIISGSTVADTITIPSGNQGALRGLNTVVWGGTNSAGANLGPGNYTVSITAAASGFTNWTQTSIDTNTGNSAVYPFGIDVDKNTNSPYYGRVVMSCALSTGNTDPGQAGFYKMNADGSIADEGWYGNANYTNDDYGDPQIAGQMPNGYGFNPGVIRIAEDDRVYWCDNSSIGTVMSCDIQATNFQVVITSGTYRDPKYAYTSSFAGPHNYQNMPLIGYLLDSGGNGIRKFDVSGLGTSNAAVYIVDTGDANDGTAGDGTGSAGVWVYRLVNGQSDTNDTVGTQVISEGPDFIATGGGLMVDYHLDLFAGQNRTTGPDSYNRVFAYTNWNGGVLPPEGAGTNYAEGLESPPASPAPAWQVGSGDTYLTGIWDTVINSRSHPTMVAACMDGYNPPYSYVPGGWSDGSSQYASGIRVFNAADGSVLATNLDLANLYDGVAFDNVGNVYGCSRSVNKWRVWSPPGTNQATTVAVPTITVPGIPPTPVQITGITVSNTTLTINFTATTNASSSKFLLCTSPAVTGPFSTNSIVSGAVFTQVSPGVFTATASTPGSTLFYRVYGPAY